MRTRPTASKKTREREDRERQEEKRAERESTTWQQRAESRRGPNWAEKESE